MTPSNLIRRRRAFTLIELLTVIAIIGILAAIIIPVVGSVRDAAKRAQCLSNVRQIGIAMKMYADDNKNVLPPLMQTTQKTWAQLLVDRKLVSKDGVFQCPSDVINNGSLRSDPAQVVRSYCYNGYIGANISESVKGVIANITTPHSQLILVGDGGYNMGIVNHSDASDFYNFDNAQHNHRPGNYGGPATSNTGANFAFMDLHVAWLPWSKYNTDVVTWRRHWPSK